MTAASVSLGRLWLGLRDGIRVALYQVAEVFGEHDYDRYVADWNVHHPDGQPNSTHRPLTAAEFFDQRLQKKYGGGFSRC